MRREMMKLSTRNFQDREKSEQVSNSGPEKIVSKKIDTCTPSNAWTMKNGERSNLQCISWEWF
jgi:hypothetical protein